MRRVMPITVSVWILLAARDFLTSCPYFARFPRPMSLFTIFLDVGVPLLIAFILTWWFKRFDYMWWVPLPFWSGFDDIFCIGIDWLSNMPTPNFFFWLYENPILNGYRILMATPFITFGTLVFSFSIAVALCTLLSMFNFDGAIKKIMKKLLSL